ncbi:grpE domain-containing protein [Hirsutella rhossiliensis]|uniref:GrpE protein homolog n=1 Tax=Hirsutella rhossiliensis TaxID=111463 RepID=A0A9P8SLI9_9HYPO|nr:grpE domain-containing protein [Hirsutella rhossiliensis]KAH0967006.1 grpE domain-containing protein [Hirsutella rhossiliensis]
MLRQGLSASSRALRSIPRLVANEPPLRPQLQTASPAFLLRPARPAATRWYSDAQATPTEGQSDKAEAKEQDGAADAVSELKKALEAKENEAKEWKDKCLRTVADFRNLQDRTQREVKTARDFAIQRFAKDLVDSVDNLDRALTTVPANKLTTPDKNEDIQDLVNLHEGLKMTETILMQTLAKHGLERLDPQGDKFDPNEHEATFMAPQPDKDNNTVFHVQQKGFKLNGRVLRAAKVGVVKNS